MAETTPTASESASLALLPTVSVPETTAMPSLILSTSVFSHTSVFSASDAAATAIPSSSIYSSSTIISYAPSSISSSIDPASTSASSSTPSSSLSTVSSSMATSASSEGVKSTAIPGVAATSSPAAPEEKDKGLSRGAKAGITLGAIALFMLICAALLLLLKKRRSRWGLSPSKPNTRPNREKRGSIILGKGRDSDADSGFEDGMGKVEGRFGDEWENGSGPKSPAVSVFGGLGGVKGVWKRDGLERVGRYEDTERGLPLPRMEGNYRDPRRGKAKERGWGV